MCYFSAGDQSSPTPTVKYSTEPERTQSLLEIKIIDALPHKNLSILEKDLQSLPLSNRSIAPERLQNKVLLLKIGEHRPLLEIRRIV
ncbi:hypothetical protein KDA_08970 [Dictyobacter alpinus]|uniref:Uncharacterized protein n=1 Tax=Dictyobacter alpinus TaxID=2014873 RepID=A0A402B244_9CHLR|nr:hypothetical protein KDA_08970 [Dictyobacter alpinus]